VEVIAELTLVFCSHERRVILRGRHGGGDGCAMLARVLKNQAPVFNYVRRARRGLSDCERVHAERALEWWRRAGLSKGTTKQGGARCAYNADWGQTAERWAEEECSVYERETVVKSSSDTGLARPRGLGLAL
jgi:hypothetical protein